MANEYTPLSSELPEGYDNLATELPSGYDNLATSLPAGYDLASQKQDKVSKAAEAKKALLAGDRSFGQIAQDTAAGVFGVGVVNVADSILGLADLALPGNQRAQARELGFDANKLSQSIKDEYYSEQVKQASKNVALDQAAFQADKEARMQETSDRLSGNSVMQALRDISPTAADAFLVANDFIKEGVDTAESLYENPTAAGQSLAESLQYINVARLGAKGASLLAEGAVAAGEVGSTLTMAGLEAGSAANTSKDLILNADPKDLYATSEEFKSLIDNGMGLREAQQKTAESAALDAAGRAALVTTVSSKLTGSGKAISDLNKKGLLTSLKAAGRTALPEGAQEFVEEGGATLNENITKKVHLNASQDLLEGVAATGTSGAISGVGAPISATGINVQNKTAAAAAAAIKGTPNAIKATANVVKATASVVKAAPEVIGTAVTNIKAAPEVIKKQVKEVKEAVVAKKVEDPSKIESPIEKMKAYTSREVPFKKTESPKEYETYMESYAKSINTIAETLEKEATEYQTLSAKENPSSKDKTRIAVLQQSVSTTAKEYQTAVDTFTAVERSNEKSSAEHKKDIDAAVASNDTTTKRNLGSELMAEPDNVNTSDLQIAVDNGVFTEGQLPVIQATIARRNASTSLEGVNSDVLSGRVSKEIGNDWKGIKQYQQEINTFLKAKSTTAAKATLAQLARFGTTHVSKATLMGEVVSALEEDNDTQVTAKLAELNTKHPGGNQGKGYVLVGSTSKAKLNGFKKLASTVEAEVLALKAAYRESNVRIIYAEGKPVKPAQEATVTTDDPVAKSIRENLSKNFKSDSHEDSDDENSEKVASIKEAQFAILAQAIAKDIKKKKPNSNLSDSQRIEAAITNFTQAYKQQTKIEGGDTTISPLKGDSYITIGNALAKELSKVVAPKKEDTSFKLSKILSKGLNVPEKVKGTEAFKSLLQTVSEIISALKEEHPSLTDEQIIKEINEAIDDPEGNYSDVTGSIGQDIHDKFIKEKPFSLGSILTTGRYLGNRVKDYFLPKNVVNKASISVLAKQRDYFTQENSVILDSVSKENRDAMSALIDYEDRFHETFIKSVFRSQNDDANNNPKVLEQEIFTDPSQLFAAKTENTVSIKKNAGGTVINTSEKAFDRNFISTLATVSFNWLATQSGSTLFNTDEDINRKLGNDTKSQVNPELRNLLQDKGDFRNSVIQTLGKEIFSKLYVQVANEDVSMDHKERMITSLGILALSTMEHKGDVTQSNINNKDFNKAMGRVLPSSFLDDTEANTVMVQVSSKKEKIANSTRERRVLALDIKGISDVVSESDALLTSLFDITDYKVMPSFNKPKRDATITTVQDTGRNVPEAQADIINKHEQVEWVAKENMASLMKNLPRPVLFEMLGGYTDEQLAKATLYNLPKYKGINETVNREIQGMIDFTAHMEKEGKQGKPFFFSHEIWQSGRLGMLGSVINPLASNFQRHVYGQKGWEVEVKTETDFRVFKEAVTEAMGFKVGQATTAAINKRFAELTNFRTKEGIVIKKGLAALTKVNAGSASKADHKDLLAAIALGKEKTWSLDALLAIQAYRDAKGGSKTFKPFTTNLFREVDGITNGVIIGMMQLVAAENWEGVRDIFAAGGIFDNATSDYGEHISKPGNYDNYEQIAVSVREFLAIPDLGIVVEEQLAALRPFIPETFDDDSGSVTKAVRNLFKYPLMITSFGASMDKVIDTIGYDFIDSMMDKIEKAYLEEDTESLAVYEAQLAEVVGDKVKLNLATAKNFRLTPLQTKVFLETVAASYGKAVKYAIEKDFDLFREKRTVLNQALGIMHRAFELNYNKKAKDIAEDKTTENAIGEVTSKGVLSRKEFDDINEELKPLMASFEHYFSTGIDEELLVTKQTSATNRDNEYKATVKLATPLAEGSNSMSGYGSSTIFEEPGVGGVIKGIHAIDSAIMHIMLNVYNALNIHDAGAIGVTDAIEMGKKFNEAFIKVNTLYSIKAKINKSLKRSIAELEKLDKENGTNFFKEINDLIAKGEIDQSFMKAGTTTPKYSGLTAFMEMFETTTKSDNKKREKFFSNITNVIQYQIKGGEVSVNDVDLSEEAVTATITKVVETRDTKEQLLDKIQEFADEGYTDAPDARSLTKKVHAALLDEANLALISEAELWHFISQVSRTKRIDALEAAGEIRPVKDTYIPIQDLFSKNNSPIYTSTTSMLDYLIGNKSIDTPFRSLAKSLKGIIKDIPIEYSEEVGGNLGQTYYTPANGFKIVLYGDGLSPSTILHEMLHAATMRLINNETTKTEAQSKALFNLSVLRTHVNDVWQTTDTSKYSPEAISRINYALTDSHEFFVAIFTSSTFELFLQKVPPLDENKSFISTLINNFAKLLGFTDKDKSALTQSIFVGNSLLEDLGGLSQGSEAGTQFDETNPRPSSPSNNEDTSSPSSEEKSELQDKAAFIGEAHKAQLAETDENTATYIRDKYEWGVQPLNDQEIASITKDTNEILGKEKPTSLPPRIQDIVNRLPESYTRMDYEEIKKYWDIDYFFSDSGIQFDETKPNSTREILLDPSNLVTVFNSIADIEAANNPNVSIDSKAHTEHLRGLMSDIVSKVMSPLKYMEWQGEANSYGKYTGDKVLVNIGSPSLVDGTVMSGQEVMSHEMLHAIYVEALEDPKNFAIRREIEKLMSQANSSFTAMDLLTVPESEATDEQKASAQARYDYMFNNPTGNGIHEFMALGDTNARIKELLENKARKVKEGEATSTLAGWLASIRNKVMGFFFNRIGSKKNVSMYEDLSRLSQQLVGIQDRKVNHFISALGVLDAGLDTMLAAADKFITAPLGEFVSKHTVTMNLGRLKNVPVGIIVNAYTGRKQLPFYAENLDKMVVNSEKLITTLNDTLAEVARRLGILDNRFMLDLLNEMRGSTSTTTRWLKLLRASNQMIDQARAKITETTSNYMSEQWHMELSKKDKTVLHNVFLKGDLGSIIKEFNTPTKLVNLLTNPTFLQNSIEKKELELEQLLEGSGIKNHYYKNQTENLGHIMITGKALREEPMFNAYSIARMDSTQGAVTPSWDINKAEDIIEVLASLHAVKFMDTSTKAKAAQLMGEEKTLANEVKSETDGLSVLFAMHDSLKKDSLDKAFNGQKALMRKGYTKEIFNPNITFQHAPLSMRAEMERDGYTLTKKEPISKDDLDGNKEALYTYVNKDGLVNTWLKTIVSLTSKRAKGTDLIQVKLQGEDPRSYDKLAKETTANGKQMRRAKAHIVAKQLRGTDKVLDPKTDTVVHPIYSNSGEITGYRYVMSEANKNSLLEKDNAFDNVMGSMAGNIEDKVASKTVNRQTVEAAKEEFDEEFAKNPNRFTVISEGATDPKYRELYRMIPQDMKNDITEIWGNQGMYVRKSMIPTIFGYRKFSVTEINKLNRPWLKKLERIDQEVVKLSKDAIVIKSGTVLADNIISNTFTLWYEGLSTKQIAAFQVEGKVALKDYTDKSREITSLQNDIASNPTSKRNKNREAMIVRLTKDIESNPVYPLIQEGMFQTIIEDIDPDEAQYTYRGTIDKITAPLTDKIPTGVKTVGNNLFLTHETGLYKMLRDTTQESDFIARYALYKYHKTLKGKEAISHEESIEHISETFVNYDIPTNKLIQYGNDIGLFMFTKFFLRTQKVIGRLLFKAPARVLGLFFGQNLLGDIPDVFDSNVASDIAAGHVGSGLHNPAAVAYDNVVGFHLLDVSI